MYFAHLCEHSAIFRRMFILCCRYKQSLAAIGAVLLVVAEGDEVLATAFLWKLTLRHRGLYQSIEELETPAGPNDGRSSPQSRTFGAAYQDYSLVHQVRATCP